MIHSYHLKYCFILIGILVIATTLIKIDDFYVIRFEQFVTYVISIVFNTLSAWIINAYLIQHNFKGISNNVKTVTGIILSIFIGLLLSYFFALLIPKNMIMRDMVFQYSLIDVFRRLVSSFFLSIICYSIYNTIYTKEILLNTRLENEQLKQAHLRAQLISLQQQISPHFLFNSLSTLKTITQEKETKHFIIQLSRVYRYLLSINENQVTKLSEELKFIHSYLYILHQRFQTALKVTVEINDEYKDYLIPPLSLQLLIENAIKHNAISPDVPLHISIYVNDLGELIISHPLLPKNIPVEGTKLGLQNINDRFRLLFNQQIRIDQTSESFTVTLPMNKDENNYH